MENKFKLFIFDLDGTLLNSLIDIAEAVNEVLTRFDLPTHPLEAYNYFVGKGIRVLAERALPHDFDQKKFPEFLAQVEAEYAQRQTRKTKPYEGILSMLHMLVEKNCKLAILSNKPDDFTQMVVKHFFAEVPFSVVLGAREEVPKKPDPDGVYEILESLSVAVSEAAFIGDTATDMQTAKNANLFAIGVSWGFRKREELEANGANVIIDYPEEILSFA